MKVGSRTRVYENWQDGRLMSKGEERLFVNLPDHGIIISQGSRGEPKEKKFNFTSSATLLPQGLLILIRSS